MKRIALFLTLAAFLLLAGRARAMSSDHYRLDWFVPLTGGGGGPASSTNYAVNFTVGQSVIGASSNTYRAYLGYWCGIAEAAAVSYRIYLPLVMRND